MVESSTQHQLYEKRGTYRGIFDASARILNIENLVKTMLDDSVGMLNMVL